MLFFASSIEDLCDGSTGLVITLSAGMQEGSVSFTFCLHESKILIRLNQASNGKLLFWGVRNCDEAIADGSGCECRIGADEFGRIC